jgi:hypothetical protein
MRANLPPWFAALLIAISPSAFAIDMVTNPDFATDTSGWTLVGAGAYRDCCFGSPDTGTLRLDAYSAGAVSDATQCVDIHKWTVTGIDFALRYFPNATSGDHLFKLEIYDTAGCTGALLDTIYPNEGTAVPVGGSPATGWLEAGDYGYALPVGALSALLDVSATGTVAGNASYFVDHVQVGPLDVIFVDDFDGD